MKATYSILVPNHARQVAIAAHHYLMNGPIKGIGVTTLSFGHPHDSLHVIGEETPELDSHMKQTGSFIGDVANIPYVDVIKQGKNTSHWQMRNQNYQPPATQVPGSFQGPEQVPLGPFGAGGLNPMTTTTT